MSKPSDKRVAIGIDLGTSYSCMAVHQQGRTVTVRNHHWQEDLIPSCVCFTSSGKAANDKILKTYYGQGAKYGPEVDAVDHDIYAPRLSDVILASVCNVKRFIGRHFDDPVTQAEIPRLPFSVVDRDNQPVIRVVYKGKNHDYLPEQVTGLFLQHLKGEAEKFLGKIVHDVVITVPARFSNAQRRATKAAAELAGLKVLQLLNELTAVAIAYAEDLKGFQTILVFNFGGGCSEASIISVKDGEKIEVLATAGNMRLGGEEIDEKLAQHLAQLFRERNGKDVSNDPVAMRLLKLAAETAKWNLPRQKYTEVHVTSLYSKRDFSTALDRDEFEEVCRDVFRQAVAPINEVLQAAKLRPKDIDSVVLAGGNSRIPCVQQMIQNKFPGKLLHKVDGTDFAHVAAHGAAVLAHSLSTGSSPLCITERAPFGIAIEINAGPPREIMQAGDKTPQTVSCRPEVIDRTMSIRVYERQEQPDTGRRFVGTYSLPDLTLDSSPVEITFETDESGILSVKAAGLTTGSFTKLSLSNDER